MAATMIGFPNRTDDSTLSGGSWKVALPLINLQNRIIGKVARSSNAALTSTLFNVDLGSSKNIRLLGLTNHNLSLASLYRVRASNESSITQLCLQTEVFSNASWVKTNTTVTNNTLASPDGTTTTDTLTATGANSTTIQDLGVLSSAGYIGSVWLARKTGTGDVQLTLDGGSTWTTKTLTTTLTRFSITQTLANPDFGVRLVTSGDEVYVWGANVVASVTLTSYYPATTATTVRAAGYMDGWQSYTYDSGWTDVWPVVYPYETLEWEDDEWWTGKYTTEQTTGYTTALIHINAMNVIARHWRVEIDDTSNSSGFVQIGRFFIGPAWQPTYNSQYGSTNLGWETKTESQEAIGGTEFFQVRTPRRVARFKLDRMTENEGFANAFEIQRRAGIDAEVLWVHDPDDTVHALRRRFLGRLRALSPIEYPYFGCNSTAFEIQELL